MDCPAEVLYIWDWFRELDGTRNNGMALGPISHTEITAWSVGMGITLLPFERQALRALDSAYLIHSNSKGQK